MRTIVFDTTPLIFLAKMGLLESVAERTRGLVPREVLEEATRRRDLPDALMIGRLVERNVLKKAGSTPSDARVFHELWGLGGGEAAALALAQKHKCALVTDDKAAMRAAPSVGVRYMTTLSIMGEMVHEGILSKTAALEKLEILAGTAWLRAEVLDHYRERFKKGGY